MRGFSDDEYGDAVASFYDDWYERQLDTAGAVRFLAAIAGTGQALSIGMLEVLRSKPDGHLVSTWQADFAGIEPVKRYRLVYCIFNTFPQLGDQLRQRQCLQRVADLLEPGGRFVIENESPDLTRWRDGQAVHVWEVRHGLVVIEASRHVASEQRIDSQYMAISPNGITFYPEVLRYVWPSELDLLAEQAGLELEQRVGDWHGAAFDDRSRWCISTYRAPS